MKGTNSTKLHKHHCVHQFWVFLFVLKWCGTTMEHDWSHSRPSLTCASAPGANYEWAVVKWMIERLVVIWNENNRSQYKSKIQIILHVLVGPSYFHSN